MKKKIFWAIIFILLTAIGIGIFILNEKVLPVIIKDKVISFLSGTTDRKVEIGRLHFHIFRGLVLSDITLYQKDTPEEKLCAIKEASVQFLIIPFLKDKKIILPLLRIASPHIRLIRQKDTTFNISDLLAKFQKTPPAQKMPDFFIQNIEITDCRIDFTDHVPEAPVTAAAEIRRLSIHASLEKADFAIEACISRNGQKSDLVIEGTHLFIPNTAKGTITIRDFDPQIYPEYLKTYLTNTPLILESGNLKYIKIDFTSDEKNISAKGTFNLAKIFIRQKGFSLNNAEIQGAIEWKISKGDWRTFSCQGHAASSNMNFSMTEPLKAEGLLTISPLKFSADTQKISLDAQCHLSKTDAENDQIKITDFNAAGPVHAQATFSSGQDPQWNYSADLEVHGQEISGIPSIGTLAGISASLHCDNNGITFKTMLIKALDTTLTAHGQLKNNILDLDVAADLDLTQTAKLIPSGITLPPHQISGTATISAHIQTDTAAPGTTAINGDAVLKNTTLLLSQNNLHFASNDGRLKFDTKEEKLQWHFDAVQYANKIYSFDGGLKNFKTPEISTIISGDNTKIAGSIIKKETLWDISSLEARFKNTKVEMTGQIQGDKNIDLSGTLDLNLGDLKDIDPDRGKTLEKISLTGRCDLNFVISGPLEHYRLWNAKITGSSDKIGLYGLNIDDVQLEYKQIQGIGYLNIFTFKAYDGQGQVNGRLDLKEKYVDYTLRTTLNDIDLDKLKKDTALKDKTFYGLFSLNLAARGQSHDAKTIAGQGSLSVRKGDIWEFNPLQGLGNFIFLPRFSKITFTNAQGDFAITSGYITTDNFELLGPDLGLIAEGSISFDGDLDLLLNTQVPTNTPSAAQEDGAKKIMKQTMSRAGSLTAVKITGTVQKPKYAVQAIGENIMKKIGAIFSNIVP